MSHLWITTFNKKLEEIGVLKRQSTSKEGSHEILINQFIQYFKNSSNKKEGLEFSKKIGQLKKLRHTSDYANQSVGSAEGRESLVLLRDLLSILKKIK